MLFMLSLPYLRPGSRKVPSSPSSARSRLAISDQLQSKFLSVWNRKAAPEVMSEPQGPVAGARSLEDLNMQFQGLICGYISHNVAAGAKILLQES